MVDAYKKMFTNYANFKDRTTRKDYWLAVLANFLVGIILGLIQVFSNNADWATYLTGIYTLAVIIPSFSMTIRRLHDTNRSGWWWLISFVPCVGGIILLVFECSASVTENNTFGVQL